MPDTTYSTFTFLFYWPREKESFLACAKTLEPLVVIEGATVPQDKKDYTYTDFIEDISRSMKNNILGMFSAQYTAWHGSTGIDIQARTHCLYDEQTDTCTTKRDEVVIRVRVYVPTLYTFDALIDTVVDSKHRALLKPFAIREMCVFDLAALYEACAELKVKHHTFLSWEDYAGIFCAQAQETAEGHWEYNHTDASKFEDLAVLFFRTTNVYHYLGVQTELTGHPCLDIPMGTTCWFLSSFNRWTKDRRPVINCVTVQLRGEYPSHDVPVPPEGLIDFPELHVEVGTIKDDDFETLIPGVFLTSRVRYAGGGQLCQLETDD